MIFHILYYSRFTRFQAGKKNPPMKKQNKTKVYETKKEKKNKRVKTTREHVDFSLIPKDDRGMGVIIDDEEAKVFYRRDFLAKEHATALYNKLVKETKWDKEIVLMYGKEIEAPRLVYYYGNKGTSYKYSGIRRIPDSKWPDELMEMKKRIEWITKQEYNFVVLNYYRNGLDNIGPHSDKESDHAFENGIIASVSLGAERDFVLQNIRTKNKKKIVKLENGSLLTMGGKCQKTYKHSIPKRTKIKSGRINLTFRCMKVVVS